MPRNNVNFVVLRSRLIAATKNLVCNGYFTERTLARHIGLSQPHLHNVLKGCRTLTPEIADRLLAFLNITVIDLIDASEISRSVLAATATGTTISCKKFPIKYLSAMPFQSARSDE